MKDSSLFHEPLPNRLANAVFGKTNEALKPFLDSINAEEPHFSSYFSWLHCA